MSLGVVVVGHGSREPAANVELEALVAAWAAARPERDVTVGYVELAQPPLADALAAAGARHAEVVALPLFLFAAGHVKNDLPLALDARAQPRPARALPRRPRARRASRRSPSWSGRARSPPRPSSPTPAVAARTALVVVGRGASDPDANGDFCKLVRLAGEGRGLLACEPTFIGITRPLVDETLERVARAPPRSHRRRALLSHRRPARRQAARASSTPSPRAARGSPRASARTSAPTSGSSRSSTSASTRRRRRASARVRRLPVSRAARRAASGRSAGCRRSCGACATASRTRRRCRTCTRTSRSPSTSSSAATPTAPSAARSALVDELRRRLKDAGRRDVDPRHPHVVHGPLRRGPDGGGLSRRHLVSRRARRRRRGARARAPPRRSAGRAPRRQHHADEVQTWLVTKSQRSGSGS